MSSVYQHMTSADPLLLGANPMQSMDLGTGKHAAAGVCRVRAAALGVLFEYAGTIVNA
jgi:hypothetical protein